MPRSPRPVIRLLAAVAVALSFTLSLAACGATGSTASATGSRGDVLRFPTTNPESLDPAKVNQAATLPRLAYASLLAVDDDGEYVGLLGDHWSWDDDTYTSLTVTLRDGLVFSDGDALTADAVVDSYAYFLATGGPNASNYSDVTIAKVDDLTVRYTSASPNPNLPMLLTDTYYGGSPISPTGIADPTRLETESHGAGPYVYDTIASGVEYTLVANDTYFDQSQIHFDSIDAPVLTSESSRTAALLSDQVDLVFSSVSTTWAQTVAANDDLTLTVGLPAWIGLELIDTQGEVVPALANLEVRQALMYALDRDAITQAVYGSDAQPRVQAANATWLGFDEALEDTYPYDVDKAKALLADAGYADGFTLPVAVTAGDVSETLLQAVGGYLDAVGITLEIDSVPDIAGLLSAMTSGTIAGIALPNAQATVAQFVSAVYAPNAVLNPLGEDYSEITTMVAAANASNSEADWQAIIQYINEQALTIPVSNAPDIWISGPDVDVSDAVNPATSQFDVLRVRAAS
ncbi:MAG: ABC transporter substrate-binding protein [Microbacterium sp.]|uniref:ABC transporter substrate-binding protein n=1 Tax=Microbacterium sp. TaxID=51671 RepID=UPI0039E3C772